MFYVGSFCEGFLLDLVGGGIWSTFYSLMDPLFVNYSPINFVILDTLSVVLLLVSGQINSCCDSYETCIKML